MPTELEVHAIAKTAAQEAVKETFLALGVNITTPEAVIKTQGAFRFVYSAHRTVERLRFHVLTVILGLVVTGIASAVWYAITATRAAGH